MPRMVDSLTLGTVAFIAVRPQNGASPATYRSEKENLSLSEQTLINIGSSVEKTASQHVFRAKVTFVKPNAPVDGIQLPADRIDLTCRLGAQMTSAEVAELKATVIAFVQSDEFDAALAGQELY